MILARSLRPRSARAAALPCSSQTDVVHVPEHQRDPTNTKNSHVDRNDSNVRGGRVEWTRSRYAYDLEGGATAHRTRAIQRPIHRVSRTRRARGSMKVRTAASSTQATSANPTGMATIQATPTQLTIPAEEASGLGLSDDRSVIANSEASLTNCHDGTWREVGALWNADRRRSFSEHRGRGLTRSPNHIAHAWPLMSVLDCRGPEQGSSRGDVAFSSMPT
jgi:hypothetical protein